LPALPSSKICPEYFLCIFVLKLVFLAINVDLEGREGTSPTVPLVIPVIVGETGAFL